MTIANALLIEKERLSLFYPVFLSFGILLGVYHPIISIYQIFVFGICFVAIVATLILKRYTLPAWLFIIFSIGIYVAQTGGICKFELLANKQFISKEYDKISFKADVGFVEETHPTMKGMQRIVLNNLKIKDMDFIKTAKMTCASKMLKDIEPRDKVRIFGRLLPYKTAAIPSSFDQMQYNSLIKMDASGIVFNIRKIAAKKSNKILDYFSYLRFFLTNSISKNISKPANGIASALLTGDKSAIPSDIRDVFIKSGTAHILAISGLHMSILSGILYAVFFKMFLYLRLLLQFINPKKYAAILSIFFSFLYLALSGFSPSATRAFIMTSICFISIAIGRGTVSLRNISFAALCILIFDPASLFLVSFQLSFGAVLALISFYEAYQKKLSKLISTSNFLSKISLYLLTSSATTLVASLATLPISISTFNRLSLTSIFGNMIAIPITSFLIAPFGIASLLFGNIFPFVKTIFEQSINILVTCITHISSMSGSNIAMRSFGTGSFSFAIIGILLLCLLKTKLRHIGSSAIFLAIVYHISDKSPNIVFHPQSGVIGFVENGEFFSTSLQKGRNKMRSIQQNIGLSGKIQKKSYDDKFEIAKRKYQQDVLLWTDNNQIMKIKQIRKSKHPYCPAYYESVNSD